MGGGNRNSQSKAERRVERKERRKAAARQDHREKAKKRDKEIKEEKKLLPKKPKAWKRRDKDGSIILWNAIKLSKTSAYLLGVMGVIALLFVASPLFEDPNYVAPERYSFAECEAIDFEDMYCIYDFKWTREYADGGTISEYAEFDPFVDLPVLGDKYTPEEQDFLPPGSDTDDVSIDLSDEEWNDILKDFSIGNFILFPMAHATHDYISGYAEHDKYDSEKYEDVNLNEFGLVFVEDELPEDKGELKKVIEQLRLDLDTIQIELQDVEDELNSWYFDEITLKNDKRNAEREWEDREESLDEAETAYRHAQDMTVRDSTDLNIQDQAFLDYKIESRAYVNAEKTWMRAQLAFDVGMDKHREEVQDQIRLNDELEDKLIELSEARIKMNLIFRDYQFININLSKTCQTLIQYELQTKCPTYREMIPLFDNTLPRISGGFVEVGYDVKRLPSPLDDHWHYYEQMTATRVVSVDADTDLFDRGVNITILAKDFTILEDTGRNDKTESYNSSTLEQTLWKNIHVSEKCDKVTVGPDLKVIEAAILHVLNKCTTDLTEFQEVIQHEPTPIIKEESAQWRYLQWIAEIVKGLRDDSNTR
jgi:hypothetical protein